MKKKRALITVYAEEWEEAQALIKYAGLPPDFLSNLIRETISGMLPVMRQAKKDQEDKLVLTQQEGIKRYYDLSKESFDKMNK